MKLLCVSDTVVPELNIGIDKQRYRDVDVILACGDLPPEYLSHLFNTLEVPVLYVKGNHDIRYGESPPRGCMNIHSRIVHYNGIRFMGVEGSRWYNGGPNQYTEKQMQRILRKMTLSLWWHKGVDVVISHAPPLGIHDAEDRCHRGFGSFRRFIDKYGPAYFIHGHIHRFFESEEERRTVVNTTQVINAYGATFITIEDRHAV